MVHLDRLVLPNWVCLLFSSLWESCVAFAAMDAILFSARLANCFLVRRKFQFVKNHCSNISCAEKFYQHTLSAFVQVCTKIHTPSFAISRVCQVSNSTDTFIKLDKKLLVKPTGMGWKHFAISASQPINNGGLGALCPKILLRALSLCLQWRW